MDIREYRKRRKGMLKLDATPMTDVIFLLLIFFMISSSFMVQTGIKVNLPRSLSRDMQTDDKVVLSISADGSMYLNKEIIKPGMLEDELRTVFLQRDDKTLIVRADESVRHGLVVSVMDTARQNGVERLSIATELKPSEGAKR